MLKNQKTSAVILKKSFNKTIRIWAGFKILISDRNRTNPIRKVAELILTQNSKIFGLISMFCIVFIILA